MRTLQHSVACRRDPLRLMHQVHQVSHSSFVMIYGEEGRIRFPVLPMLPRLFPQSSLDHFHVHREPSRLVNPSVAQNETSCRPSPCDRLSRPRTTTTAPPLVRLVGETWEGVNLPGCAITLLGRASLVPWLTLKRPRLAFDSWTPNSGLLLPRNIAK